MKHGVLLMLWLTCLSAFAQREYAICDSTFYPYNNDTTIVAGKHKLYIRTADGTAMLHDFTTPDPRYYIRDFDIIRPALWYTLVGTRSISNETYLYRSADRGQTWALDTSFFQATRYDSSTPPIFYNSLNQVQLVGPDSIVLFVGYYESGIVYSLNGGLTWQYWFRNLINHYQGLFRCDDQYYLYGFDGDAFTGCMFPFHKNLLFSPDTNQAWYAGQAYHLPCITARNTPGCICVASSTGRCDQYRYFKDTLEKICTNMSAALAGQVQQRVSFSLWPNPAHEVADISLAEKTDEIRELRIYDLKGREVFPSVYWFDRVSCRLYLNGCTSGVYSVVINTRNGNVFTKKLVLQ